MSEARTTITVRRVAGQILILLEDGPLTVKQMAEKVNSSTQTVWRAVNYIRRSGIGIKRTFGERNKDTNQGCYPDLYALRFPNIAREERTELLRHVDPYVVSAWALAMESAP